MEQLLVTQDWQLRDTVAPLIHHVEPQLCQESMREPWASRVPFLIQQTGIGLLTAMILIAAIGDTLRDRFSHAAKLVGYAGLGARVHDSAETPRGGGITKQGRRDLRAAMVEAAWIAVIHKAHWKPRFGHLGRRWGKQKAIGVIARPMLVVVGHVGHDRESDQNTEPTTIARKMMVWAERGGKGRRQNLTASAFVRLHLDHRGIGQDLTEVRRGNPLYKLPPASPVNAADVH